MKILWEDKAILLVEKPAGVLSEPSEQGDDVVSLLTSETGKPVFLVHRLDRNTGGVMALAKSGDMAAKLSGALQNRDFIKEYFAVLHGVPPEPEGLFEDLLFKDSAKNKTFVVKRERKGVKKASLSYRLLDTAERNGEAVSLVLVRLHTGRTHQVRVQFASRKMPLLGDGKYGSRDNGCEMALWSARLSFSHPKTGETVTAQSVPPRIYPWDLFREDRFSVELCR